MEKVKEISAVRELLVFVTSYIFIAFILIGVGRQALDFLGGPENTDAIPFPIYPMGMFLHFILWDIREKLERILAGRQPIS